MKFSDCKKSPSYFLRVEGSNRKEITYNNCVVDDMRFAICNLFYIQLKPTFYESHVVI